MYDKSFRFSVIIPVYNADKYLRDCLNSILSQSYSNFQLIVVNDGSTDNSKNILDEYVARDSRIKIINKINQGPLLARVDAIREADSDYCVFIDSDDLLVPGFFEPLLEGIKVKEHDIFIYSYEQMSSNGESRKKAKSLFPDQYIFTQEKKMILYRAIVELKLNSLWIKAIKTKLLKEDATDFFVFSDIFFGEDLLLFLYPVTIAKSIKYLDLPLYRYRTTEDSISRTPNLKKLNCILKVYIEMYRYIQIWDDREKSLDRIFLSTYGKTIINFFCSSILQGSKFFQTRQIIQGIRMNDLRYNEYLNEIFTTEIGFFRTKKMAGFLLKHRQYFLVYLYYKIKRLFIFIVRKII